MPALARYVRSRMRRTRLPGVPTGRAVSDSRNPETEAASNSPTRVISTADSSTTVVTSRGINSLRCGAGTFRDEDHDRSVPDQQPPLVAQRRFGPHGGDVLWGRRAG